MKILMRLSAFTIYIYIHRERQRERQRDREREIALTCYKLVWKTIMRLEMITT